MSIQKTIYLQHDWLKKYVKFCVKSDKNERERKNKCFSVSVGSLACPVRDIQIKIA